MRKKILLVLALWLSWFAITWFYTLLFLGWAVWLWRKEIRERVAWPHINKVLVGIWCLLLFVNLPRYRIDTNDRVRLIYQDDEDEPTHAPFYQYVLNALLPEEEVMHVGLHVVGMTGFIPYGNLMGYYAEDYHRKGAKDYVRCMTDLRAESNPLSGFTSQFFNDYTHLRSKSVYVISPEHYDPDRSYPVVFFCHGFLGNWRLYQGALLGLQNCIVLSVGTHGLSGIYTADEVEELFTKQLSFLEKLGYKVDRSQLHLIGLSNGGSAASYALSNSSKQLKSITFLSCEPIKVKRVSCRINLIGGGNDFSTLNQPDLLRHFKAKGVDVAMEWDEERNHFTVVNDRDEVIRFLSKRLLLSPTPVAMSITRTPK